MAQSLGLDGKSSGGSVSTRLRDSLAGASSAVFSSVVLQPFDVVRTRQQMHLSDTVGKYSSVSKTVTVLYKEEGLSAFWRGTGPTIWRVLPGGALYFGLLSFLSDIMRSGKDDKKLSTLSAAASAATARATAGTMLHPISVVKTRFEAFNYAESANRTTIGTLVDIGKTDGLRGLFRGLGPTLFRDVPYSSINFAVYTAAKDTFTGVPDSLRFLLASSASGLLSTLITHPFDVMRTRLQTNKSYASSWDVIRKGFEQEGFRTLSRGFWPRLIRRTLSSAVTWTSFEMVAAFLKKSLASTKPET